jgi:adenylate kinase family enzyme
MKRISVVGSSASGKTTVACAIAKRLGYPLLELDGVYHLPDWIPLPEDEFRAAALKFAEQDRWVIDGNYTSLGVLEIVWQHADTVVWLDPPKRVVMWQAASRAISRAATGEELWNGNRERWPNLLRWAPEDNIVRWAWTRFDHTRERYERRMNDPAYNDLSFVRLRSRSDVNDFIESLL